MTGPTPGPQGPSAEKVHVAYAALLVNSYEEERDVELGVFDTRELAQKCLDDYAIEYRKKYPGKETIWYLSPRVVEQRTIDAADLMPIVATARADERVKARNEALTECANDDAAYAASCSDDLMADAWRSSAHRHLIKLMLSEAPPVEPSKGRS